MQRFTKGQVVKTVGGWCMVVDYFREATGEVFGFPINDRGEVATQRAFIENGAVVEVVRTKEVTA